jgi:hypothetical protein
MVSSTFLRQLVRVAGYEETMRTAQPMRDDNSMLSLAYEAKEALRPADAFFFVSKYVIKWIRETAP